MEFSRAEETLQTLSGLLYQRTMTIRRPRSNPTTTCTVRECHGSCHAPSCVSVTTLEVIKTLSGVLTSAFGNGWGWFVALAMAELKKKQKQLDFSNREFMVKSCLLCRQHLVFE